MALQILVAANSKPCINPLPSVRFPPKIRSHPLLFFNSSVNKSKSISACLAAKHNQEVHRPLAHFAPTIWKDANIFTSSLPISEIESNDRRAEELKQKVKEMLITPMNDPVEKVSFIESICRLGVSYHFENEIEEQLNQIFEAQPNVAENDDYDLYIVALLFRVFRQHGYKISCSVFDKFKDSNGTFKENLAGDARGMLSLYEATHLRVHGEDILEEALDFTTTHLKSLAKSSPDHLAKQITSALEAPLHKNIPRLETHKYISFYQEDLGEYRNETLLIFAKLDFNRVQLLHQQELNHVTSWWKDNEFTSKFSYSRDRIVETYFWTTANYFEPCYSRARIVQTKLMMIITIIDDTYDAYGTLEELQSFTDALERWDTHATGDLPDYMKTLYSVILNHFEELNNDVSEEGRSYSVSITKNYLKEYMRACLVEAKWFNEGSVPSFNQRLSNALLTAASGIAIAASFVGMGETAGINEFEWLQNHPKIVEAAFIIGRLKADIKAHEFEQKRGHVATTVDCYMKQYGISKEETVEKFEKILIANAWKDINEEYMMKQTDVSRKILLTLVNFARSMEILYKNQDGITFPEDLKDYITKLFIDPIPV